MRSKAFIYLLLLVSSSLQDHSISKRNLLFPQYTVLQFTYGLSVPLILPTRSINLSWCVQANYNLPYNLSNFDSVYARMQEGVEPFDLNRISFYEYVINILDGFGLAGEECLLRSVCEVADIPLHIDDDTVLEKIFHYLLTPSIDVSVEGNNSLQHKLLVAERLGKVHGNCGQIFNDCDVNLVESFTALFLQ